MKSKECVRIALSQNVAAAVAVSSGWLRRVHACVGVVQHGRSSSKSIKEEYAVSYTHSYVRASLACNSGEAFILARCHWLTCSGFTNHCSNATQYASIIMHTVRQTVFQNWVANIPPSETPTPHLFWIDKFGRRVKCKYFNLGFMHINSRMSRYSRLMEHSRMRLTFTRY